jgi:predicted site-specific integrase-resolvase
MAEERINMTLAAKIFGVSKSTVIRRMKAGKILPAKLDQFGYYYWTKDEFEAYMSDENKEKLRMLNGY